MPEIKDKIGTREKVHIVLRGPDGKIKDERNLGGETEDETDNKPVSQ